MARKTTAAGMKRAISLAGSQEALAERLGVSQAAVSYWLTQAKAVPAERAVQIEAVTDGAVSRKELRPDLWG
jgi:DNA-binding transcriptional regulator YdaS (Cro superfamily)